MSLGPLQPTLSKLPTYSVLRLTRVKPVEAADIVRQWTAAADRVLFVYWITGVLITIRMFIHDEQVAPTLSRTGNE